MRDPELLIQLLKEMSEDTQGRVIALNSAGATLDAQRRRHHVELLADAKHAKWVFDDVARITSRGYDFLHAVEKQPKARTKFLGLFEKGLPFAEAATRAIECVNRIMPG